MIADALTLRRPCCGHAVSFGLWDACSSVGCDVCKVGRASDGFCDALQQYSCLIYWEISWNRAFAAVLGRNNCGTRRHLDVCHQIPQGRWFSHITDGTNGTNHPPSY